MGNFNSGWYVAYTKPRHEKKVAGRLSEIGIDSFLPTTRKIKTRHDRRKCLDEPLFPSYVFIYLTDKRSYYTGVDMDGVLYFVRTGKEIARIHESVVNNIRLAVNAKKEVEVSEHFFQPGRQMVITHGALTGLFCEIVQLDGKQKVLVRVDLLQRNILLTLSAEYLTSI